jgi:hypothetical protein
MGRGLAMKELSSFTGTSVESLFHEQSLTIPPAQQVGFETTKEFEKGTGTKRSVLMWRRFQDSVP